MTVSGERYVAARRPGRGAGAGEVPGAGGATGAGGAGSAGSASPPGALGAGGATGAAGLASPPGAPGAGAATGAAGPPQSVTLRDTSELGPLQRFAQEPDVTDIFVNGPDALWVDRGSGLVREPGWSCPGEPELRELAVRLVALGGRHIDEASPCVDVRLNDGMRLHAVLPPVSPRGTLLSLRIPRAGFLHLDDLARSGFFGPPDGEPPSALQREIDLRGVIDRAVCERSNLLITGAGGSGKTTFLSALLSSAARDERIVAIEDVAELQVDHPHFVSLEARQPNLEGAGGITLDRLLREALRMRPDRLVLGECRGPEIRELLSALNTGHDGGAGTLHANSLADVPARLEALGALAGLSPTAIARQAVSAIGLILHLERRGPRRHLAAVGTLALDDRGCLLVRPLPPPAPSPSPTPSLIHAAAGSSPQASRQMAGGRHA